MKGKYMNRILRTISFISGIISVASFLILMFVYFERITGLVNTVAGKGTKKIKLPMIFELFK